jgi:CheY-like chemotaxis protein
VVWNLLSNAIKFPAKGGEVRIGLRQVEGDIEIKVTDTGRGIHPDFLPFVFNSFRQADPVSTRTHGGLGLGLAIVRHLVELHGGRTRAESAGEGQGATFIVRLPRRVLKEDLPEPAWMLRSDSPPDTISVQLNGVSVLFVDDQADARELVKELLELHGAKVTSVETAEQALEAMQRDQFQVLLSDIGLPMVDGYELIRQIRRLPPERGGRIPAVAVTGFARSEDSQRALAEGFQNHLSKPIEPKELVDLVATLSTAQPH